MINNIIQLLQSGFSRRWHSNPDMSDKADELAQHQWNVAMLVLYLRPNCSKKLLVEALTHDVGEMIAGDLGYDFKINNPEVSSAHKVAEENARKEIVDFENGLTEDDLFALKTADWLSSYWWVAIHHPKLLNRHDWVSQKEYFSDFCSRQVFAKKAKFLIEHIENIAKNGYMEKIDLNWSFNKGLEEYKAA